MLQRKAFVLLLKYVPQKQGIILIVLSCYISKIYPMLVRKITAVNPGRYNFLHMI